MWRVFHPLTLSAKYEHLVYFLSFLDIFARAMGRKNFDDGTNLLLEALQYPRLNKQVSY